MYAKINGIRLYYEREGKGDPLVLIGGYGCDLSWWDTIRPTLARHFHLILLENRGCGRTACPKTSFSIEDMGEDVILLIEQLKLVRPHILGQSMGGAIAQVVAYSYPKQIGKLVLSQTFMKTRPIANAAFLHATNLRKDGVSPRHQIESTLPWTFSDAFMQDKANPDAFIEKLLSNPYPMSLSAQVKQFDAIMDFDSRSCVKKIKAPTLVLAGEQDYLCPLNDSRQMAKSIPKAKLVVFPKMSHNGSIEIPKEYCAEVIRFLTPKGKKHG